MSITRFEIFSNVIELGSFTKAGEKLNMTQSAVSHAVAGLESELGIKLLLRDRKKGFTLTEAGQRILIHMQEVLNQMEQIKQVVAFTSNLESGTIRIGSFSSATACVLPKIIAVFQRKYPNITFSFFEGTYEEILEWFEKGVIDLGVVVEQPGKELNTLTLMQDRMVVAFPADHRFHSMDTIDVAELQGESFIMPKGVYRAHVDHIFSQTNVQPNVRFEVQDCNTLTSMVQEGLGVTIGPELFLKDQMNVHIAPLAKSNWRSIALAFPATEYISPAIQAFLAVAKDVFREK